MYNTQCVPRTGCKLTIPTSILNGPTRRYISTLSNPIEPRICCIFTFDVALFFKSIFIAKSLNDIFYFVPNHLDILWLKKSSKTLSALAYLSNSPVSYSTCKVFLQQFELKSLLQIVCCIVI